MFEMENGDEPWRESKLKLDFGFSNSSSDSFLLFSLLNESLLWLSLWLLGSSSFLWGFTVCSLEIKSSILKDFESGGCLASDDAFSFSFRLLVELSSGLFALDSKKACENETDDLGDDELDEDESEDVDVFKLREFGASADLD